jgi:nitrogen fixation protein NifU and related proteins
MYSAKLIEHFEHPRNVGDLPDASVRVKVENPACGDIMTLALLVNGGVVEQVRFQTRGCVASIGCGSALTELVAGKSVAEAGEVTRDDIVKAVGGLPEASAHAGHLAIDALRSALHSLTP